MDEKEKNQKINDYLGKGILLLIFLLLFIQFVIFISKVGTQPTSEVIIVRDTIYLRDTIYIYPSKTISNNASYHNSKAYPAKSYPPKSYPAKSFDSTKYQQANNAQKHQSNTNYKKWQKKELVDLNSADSLMLLQVPGIGPYYASKIIEYRKKLGGFVVKEQLLELWKMDSVKFEMIAPRVKVNLKGLKKIDLYTMPLDSMKYHPYIGFYAAEAIVRYRSLVPRDSFNVQKLFDNKIITKDKAWRLKLYSK